MPRDRILNVIVWIAGQNIIWWKQARICLVCAKDNKWTVVKNSSSCRCFNNIFIITVSFFKHELLHVNFLKPNLLLTYVFDKLVPWIWRIDLWWSINNPFLFPFQKCATEECFFFERLESNNYNTYRSRKYSDWYVALKRTGQYKPGPKTGPGQKAILFLPMSAKSWFPWRIPSTYATLH